MPELHAHGDRQWRKHVPVALLLNCLHTLLPLYMRPHASFENSLLCAGLDVSHHGGSAYDTEFASLKTVSQTSSESVEKDDASGKHGKSLQKEVTALLERCDPASPLLCVQLSPLHVNLEPVLCVT